MSCAEGKRLSIQFLQSAMATRALESEQAPKSIVEKNEKEQEIERAQELEKRCKQEVTEHAESCPACGPGEK